MAWSIQRDAWLAVLSYVFRTKVVSRLDSVDIDWEDLNKALDGMDKRQVLALEMRYGQKLTFKEIGIRIGRKDGSGPVDKNRAAQILSKALNYLRNPIRMRILRSSIVGWWNLEDQERPFVTWW